MTQDDAEARRLADAFVAGRLAGRTFVRGTRPLDNRSNSAAILGRNPQAQGYPRDNGGKPPTAKRQQAAALHIRDYAVLGARRLADAIVAGRLAAHAVAMHWALAAETVCAQASIHWTPKGSQMVARG